MSVGRVLLVASAIATTFTAAAVGAPTPVAGKSAGSASPPPAAGSSAGSGSAMPNPDDAPPKDMNGTDENPGNARTVGNEPPAVVVAPKPVTRAGYPMEEVLRPITLPKNMTQLQIGPHFEVDDQSRQGFASSDARSCLRYGITSRVEIGLIWAFAGIFHDPSGAGRMTSGSLGLNSGKAAGLEVTVSILPWLAVRAGVPIYVSPDAVSLTLGAPIKAVFFDKLALGGLEELFNFKLDRFPVQFYQEYDNAVAAFETQSGGNNTQQSGGSTETFLHVGLQWTPKPYLDLGFTLGFDDLAHAGTFGPQGLLAFRL